MNIKTIFLIFIASLMLLIPAKSFAKGQNDYIWRKISYERKVNSVGQKILLANEISEMITFRVPSTSTKKSQVNAHADGRFAVITVERPLLKVIDNDDELAGILSHEIAHLIQNHGIKGVIKRKVVRTVIMVPCFTADVAMAAVGCPLMLFSNAGNFLSEGLTNHSNQKYETEADDMAIDIMVKAGYNPVYMESIYKKIMSDGYYVTFFRTHPPGSERVAAIHEKIATEYPQFIEEQIEENKIEKEKNISPVSSKNPNKSENGKENIK